MKRIVFVALLMMSIPAISYGQGCSVCTKTAAGQDNRSARGLNGGILYLAFLPLGIMGTVGFLWWKHNKK
jgi:hypothetical protein